MNVLRELRKLKRKSVIAKLRILVLLGVLLIGSTYAWFLYNLEPPSVSGIVIKPEKWDVEYRIDDTTIDLEKTKEVVIAIDEFYPGMTAFEKNVIVRNFTPKKSSIKLEVASVKLFGEEIVEELKTTGNIVEAGMGQSIFNTEDYPFNAGFSYDKNVIEGMYEDDISTPEATAKLTLYANWTYERESQTKTKEENDILDTKFGERAYEYYKSQDKKIALEITIKISTGREGFDN